MGVAGSAAVQMAIANAMAPREPRGQAGNPQRRGEAAAAATSYRAVTGSGMPAIETTHPPGLCTGMGTRNSPAGRDGWARRFSAECSDP
jgi:hypothetical protein